MSQSHPRRYKTTDVHTRSSLFAISIINAIEQQVYAITECFSGVSSQEQDLKCLFHSLMSNYKAIEWSWDAYSDAGWFTFSIAGCNCDIYYDPEVAIPVEHKIDVYLLASELGMDIDTAGFVLGNIHALFIVLEELFNS